MFDYLLKMSALFENYIEILYVQTLDDSFHQRLKHSTKVILSKTYYIVVCVNIYV